MLRCRHKMACDDSSTFVNEDNLWGAGYFAARLERERKFKVRSVTCVKEADELPYVNVRVFSLVNKVYSFLWRWYINITITVLDIIHHPVFYLKSEREGGGVGSERHYISGGGDGNIIFCFKVPRQCPLVLLIGVRFYFKVIEVGGAEPTELYRFVRTLKETH
jgi:hypothetical protein